MRQGTGPVRVVAPVRGRRCHRAGAVVAAVTVLAVVGCSGSGSTPSSSTAAPGSTTIPATAACPTEVDPKGIADARGLRTLNAFVAGLGVRPTGSAAQVRYIDWIESHLHDIAGVKVTTVPYTIQRWSSSSASLELQVEGRWVQLPIAAPIAYSKGTAAAGVTAPLVLVPDDQDITAADAKGKIVVRPAPPGSVPNSVFSLSLVTDQLHDPHHTLDPKGTFYGDFLNYNARVADLEAAGAAGAAGIVFVKDLPRTQLAGHYEPYEGEQWKLPGVWVGADEGKDITDAISGDAGPGSAPEGRITIRATVAPVVTRTVIATIPGRQAARIVVESHTDGTNAVEDNGPVAMIAMTRYLASLPLRCRPRTIQFSFDTAHFYQRLVSPTIRNGGAEAEAEQLDRGYDAGTVSSVLTIEHLGSKEYAGVPRTDGGPGQLLELTGQRTLQQIFVTPSPALVAAVNEVVGQYGVDRTVVMKGADVPGTTDPPHCDFGGEGTPFDKHLLPTIGVISAPQSLYDPAFGMAGIDFDVMHAETLAYTTLVLQLGRLLQPAVAGDVTAERAARAKGGTTACP